MESVDYPKLEIPEDVVKGLGLKRQAPHAAILKLVTTNICGSDQHMVRGRTTAPVGPDPRPRDHRRGGRGRRRRAVRQGGRHLLGAVQHRLRPLPDVQRGQDRYLPQREPGPRRSGLRLRRHGWLARRAGRVRDGAVRRLQPAEVPRPGPGAGEDPRPDDAVRHLPDRVPRRLHRRGDHGIDGLRRGRGTGRPRRGALGSAARRLRRHRRGHERRPAGGRHGASAARRSTSAAATSCPT